MPESPTEYDGSADTLSGSCYWCSRPLRLTAEDPCANPIHRATDKTLGIRDTDCGCCVVVDAAALNLLRGLVAKPGDPGEFSVLCDPDHLHDGGCGRDEIGDWWHRVYRPKGGESDA